MAHELQVRYSSLVDMKLRATMVTNSLFNRRYEGNPKAGSVKIPVRDTEVAVGDYNIVNGAAQTQGATTYLTVTIDNDKSVNELIDGFDAAAVPDNLVADRLDSAGYSLGLTLDQDAITTLETEGTSLADTTAITKDTVYKAFVDMRTTMSKANVPLNGRWAIVSPEIFGMVLLAPEFIKASDLGDAVVQTGAIGRIAGFTLYESNLMNAKSEIIAGHMDWCARIEEWGVSVHLQDLNGSGKWIGASAVQGRKIYKHKVTKSQCVQVKKKA